jgi:glycolate oxidase FAD binding subunit
MAVAQHKGGAICAPETEADLAGLLRGATAPFRITGGGTRAVGQCGGAVLSTAALSGITLYEPGALTIVARAGTPLAQIEAVLASENQRLPFEPPQMAAVLGRDGVSTIGGVVAANASGPRRFQAGACRDSLIGVRFVDGRGEIIKNGGRVMKNVTGYDLVKLMAGSHGTLGVLTEVAFKVLPDVAALTTVQIAVPDAAAAVAVMARALGTPFEVSGAAYTGDTVHLRLDGFASSVAYRAGRLTDQLADAGAVKHLDADASRPLWAGIRDVRALADGQGDLWRINLRPSDAPAALAALEDCTFAMDWGGGLIWAQVPAGRDVRAALQGIGGHATLMRGTGHPALPPEAEAVARLSAGIRAQFDPKGLFNPGLMG